jgi:uncharacterized protein (TIGR00106 family)
MAIAEVTIIPIGTESTSLSSYVADLQKLLQEAPENIKFQLTPMSTIIEGSPPDLFAVLQRLHEASFRSGAKRVSTSVKIDDRRDKPSTMDSKLKSVEAKLGGER